MVCVCSVETCFGPTDTREAVSHFCCNQLIWRSFIFVNAVSVETVLLLVTGRNWKKVVGSSRCLCLSLSLSLSLFGGLGLEEC